MDALTPVQGLRGVSSHRISGRIIHHTYIIYLFRKNCNSFLEVYEKFSDNFSTRPLTVLTVCAILYSEIIIRRYSMRIAKAKWHILLGKYGHFGSEIERWDLHERREIYKKIN